jgi:hypothetical protein
MNRRYLLMLRKTSGGLDETHDWAAAEVPGIGKALTRDQAEHHAEQLEPPPEVREAPGPRFLLPLRPESEPLADVDSPKQLTTGPGETIWGLGGELARADMVAILRDAAGDGIPGGGTPSPSPGMAAVAGSFVVERARRRFGPCEAHEIEAVFDRLMLDVGGLRHGDAAFYQVPVGVLGLPLGGRGQRLVPTASVALRRVAFRPACAR